MACRGRSYYRFAVALAAWAACCGAGPRLLAQQFETIPVKLEAREANALRSQVSGVLRGTTAPDAAATKVLDDFFIKYYFPSMTSVDPVELGALNEKRSDLFQRYINMAKSAGARDHITALALQAMNAIARRNCHPAVRYNAALILGQLDQEGGAKPLAASTEALIALAQNDEFNKVPVPTAVKLAAIVSLQRQTTRGIDAKYAAPITEAALAIATRKEVPEDASEKVFGWVRRQAARLLAQHSAGGITPPVHQAFLQLISDESMDLDDRCGAAELLQPAMYETAQGVDRETMAIALGKLARDVLEVEAEDAEDYLDEMLQGGNLAPPGGGFGGRGMGMGMGGREMGMGGRGMGMEMGMGMGMGGRGMDMGFGMDLEPQGPKYDKRRMIDRTVAIVAAAQALASGGSDELKNQLAELADAIRTVAENAAPENAGEAAVAEAVLNLSEQVSLIVAKWAPEDAAADEELDEGFGPPAADPAEADEAEPAAPPAEAPAAAAAAG